MPATCKSLAYSNSPVVFGTPSARRTLSPIQPSLTSVPGMTLLMRASPRRSSAFRCQPHGVEDLCVPRAAAEVAGQRLADLVVARIRVLAQQVRRCDDEARRAEAALHGACL